MPVEVPPFSKIDVGENARLNSTFSSSTTLKAEVADDVGVVAVTTTIWSPSATSSSTGVILNSRRSELGSNMTNDGTGIENKC